MDQPTQTPLPQIKDQPKQRDNTTTQISKIDEFNQKIRKWISLSTLTLLTAIFISIGFIPGLPIESMGYLIEVSSFFMLLGALSQLYFIYRDYQTWKALKAEGLPDDFMAYLFSDFVPQTLTGKSLLVLSVVATGVIIGLTIAFFLGNAAFLQPFFDAVFHFLDNALLKMVSDFGGSLVSPALSQFAANVFGAVFLSVLPLVLLNSCRAFSANTNGETSCKNLQNPPEIAEKPAHKTQSSSEHPPAEQNNSLANQQDTTAPARETSSAKNESTANPPANPFAHLFHQLPEEEKELDQTFRIGVVVKPIRKTPMYADMMGTRKGELWNFNDVDYLLLKGEPQNGKVLVETIPHLCAHTQKRYEAYVDIKDIEFFAGSEEKHLPKRFPNEYIHGCHKLEKLSFEQIVVGAHVMAIRNTKPDSCSRELKLKEFEIYKIIGVEDSVGDPIFTIQSVVEESLIGLAVWNNFWYVNPTGTLQSKLAGSPK